MPPKNTKKVSAKETSKEAIKVAVKAPIKNKKEAIKKWAEVKDEYQSDHQEDLPHANEFDNSDSCSSDSSDSPDSGSGSGSGSGSSSSGEIIGTLNITTKNIKTTNSTQPNSIIQENIKKSIIDFDYEKIHKLDKDGLAAFDTNTLIKILMVRGTKTNNPVLWSKCSTLLKLLNFELPPRENNYRGGRGGTSRGRGNSHSRGGRGGNIRGYNNNYNYNHNYGSNELEHSDEPENNTNAWRGGRR